MAVAAVPSTHSAERNGDRWGPRTARQVVIKEHHYWARYSVLQITSMRHERHSSRQFVGHDALCLVVVTFHCGIVGVNLSGRPLGTTEERAVLSCGKSTARSFL